jgi:putative ABC transport system substrate-binding protein
MKRREFIALLGGAAAAWPLAARAQQLAAPVIGYLSGASAWEFAHLAAAFRRGLNETGYVEHRNVGIEYRWAEGRYERLPALADELVRRPVTVIAATGGAAAALAAKAATTTIPIVFSTGGFDPVEMGLVASFNRPGGNVTGVYSLAATLEPKRLGLLRELVPTDATIAVLMNPTNPNTESQVKITSEAARSVGQQIHFLNASTERDLDAAFATMAQLRLGALLVGPDPFFYSRRDHIVALAARYAIPAIYEERSFAVAGGLVSYGTSFTDAYRHVGVYTAKILKGDKPADLPVFGLTRFEFVINLKTAKALGLDVPAKLLALTDEVIE